MKEQNREEGLFNEEDLRYVKQNINYYLMFMNGFSVLTKTELDLLTPIELRRFAAAMALKREWEEKAVREAEQKSGG